MSDKTTAALAAEQADTEATTTQEAELLPAATLDELEQVDPAPSQRASAPRSVSLTTAVPTGPSARSPTSAASTTA